MYGTIRPSTVVIAKSEGYGWAGAPAVGHGV